MQTTVLVNNPFTAEVEAWRVDSAGDLLRQLEETWGTSHIEVTANGDDLFDCDFHMLVGSILDARVSVLGGKGGYGSLLRVAAAQKKHFNNFDSSRDAMGRRLRDIKNEHRLIQFVKKKQQEDEIMEKEKKALEELQKQQKMLKPSGRELAAQSIQESYTRQIQQRDGALRNLVARAYLAKRTPKHLEESEQLEAQTKPEGDKTKPNVAILKLIHRKTGRGAPKLELAQPSSSGTLKNRNIQEESQNTSQPISGQKPNQPQPANKKVEGNLSLTRVEGSSSSPTPLQPSFDPIDLEKLKSLQEVLKLNPESVKHHLKSLGLKCGGRPEERAKRLWDVKTNPACLLDHRYLAKQ